MKLYNYTLLSLLLILATSCLKSGLEDLETYNQTEMTNVRFEYRWWDENKKQLRVMQMSTDKIIDKDKKTITCTIIVPEPSGMFTKTIRDQVVLTNLAANVDISTAARIKPIGKSPALGILADFSSKEFTYKIIAADGKNSAEWIIKIIDLKK